MRNFERQADIYVYALLDSAKPLISSLKKIAVTSGQPPDKPNWHHFSIKERIDYLKKCESDRKWITRHDSKVKKSIAAYLVGILLIGGVGYHISFGETGKKLSTHFLEKILQKEIEKTPDNPTLFSMLGDIYYSKNNYEETIKAYERSINLEPDNPQVLNNLAWLYATCDEKGFRDPEKALVYAEKAARMKTAPHILDTLAESYYVNGKYKAAVSAEMRALALAKKGRSYYEGQLKKFRKAAREEDNK